MEKLPGYAEACKLKEAYLSTRAKELETLERYVKGTQYDGLPDWFSDAHKKPLWERAPCIVTPIVKSAIASNGDLLLGESRFPVVSAEGLSGEDANSFEKATATAIQQSRLRAAAREVFAAGQGHKSACAVFGIRGERLFIDTVLARWCEPQLTLEGAVESLEIKYPYLVVEKDGDGRPKVVCKLFRRVIDAQSDVTYKPADAREDVTEPKWVEADGGVTNHGFGFCPVVWYAHMQGCAAVNDYDGNAIHQQLLDEIRAYDFAESQKHRAALYVGDPQWTEIGVQPGFNPTSSGRTSTLAPAGALRPGFNNYTSEAPTSASKARKKSPGTVWQYPGDASKIKVELHCLPGDALAALQDHARSLRSQIAEGLGVVFIDPESLPNESRLSGKALESFKSPQLNHVDCYRADFGDKFLLPALGMLLRIAIKKQLKIDSLDVVQRVVGKDQWSWHAPALSLVWGDYFQPTGEEEHLLMQAAVKAKEAGIATTKILVKKHRSLLGIRDVEAYMTELEAEAQKARDEAQEDIKLEASLKPTPAASAPKSKK
jgi:hypothetical protein